MTVERRYSDRLTVEFDVEIRYRGRRVPIAHARNISQDGMYVRINHLTLPRGNMLELQLRRWGREWLILAIVVHDDTRGVGLMFRETQSELYDYEIGALTESVARLSTPEAAPSRAGL